MSNSVFDPLFQETDLSSKVVAGLERISEVFKVLLWDKAKQIGISPIQIQILIFVKYHKPDLCKVSHLAREFNVTKPTISDAIKVLNQKKMILKNFSSSDSRSYTIRLSALGERAVLQTSDLADPLKSELDHLKQPDLEGLFKILSELIYKLNQNGILSVQRTCYGCQFYEKNKSSSYCKLLEKELQNQDIRLDCPDYLEKN